jgi:hypothetical protein
MVLVFMFGFVKSTVSSGTMLLGIAMLLGIVVVGTSEFSLVLVSKSEFSLVIVSKWRCLIL